jgi:hypothetical protein
MAIIVAGKTVSGALVAWEPLGLVRETIGVERRRRRKRFPEELQRTAELESVWAEILVEAGSRTPERVDRDPHVLKLSRIPTP